MSEKKYHEKEFKVAVKAFNLYLAEKKMDEVVIEGLDIGQQITNFLAPIIHAFDTGKTGELPAEVIEYYNNYLAEEEDEEETGEETEPETDKSSKKKKKKGRKKKEVDPDALKPWQKPMGKEKLVYNMVAEGKSDKEIEKAIRDAYPDKEKAFVDWRVYTYMIKGKNFFAKDNPDFAAKWNEEKKNIAVVPHPSKAEKHAEREAERVAKKKAKEEEKAKKKAEKEAEKAAKKKAKPAKTEKKEEPKKTEKSGKKEAPAKTEKKTSSKKKSDKKGK